MINTRQKSRLAGSGRKMAKRDRIQTKTQRDIIKKILYLTLYRGPFDLIRKGFKKIEYRNSTPYWFKRLTSDPNFAPLLFDEIHFRNGYGNHRPLVKTKHRRTLLNLETNKFEIMLGNIIQ